MSIKFRRAFYSIYFLERSVLLVIFCATFVLFGQAQDNKKDSVTGEHLQNDSISKIALSNKLPPKNELAVLSLTKAQFLDYFKSGKRIIFQFTRIKTNKAIEVIAWRNGPKKVKDFETTNPLKFKIEESQGTLNFDNLNVILGDQKISFDTRKAIENKLDNAPDNFLVVFVPDTLFNEYATELFQDSVYNLIYKIDIVPHIKSLKPSKFLTLQTNPSPPASTRLRTQL